MIRVMNKIKDIFSKDNDIVSVADAKVMDIENVKDKVFSNKLMGEGIAFEIKGNIVNICAPISGELITIFPTGHAFGIRSNSGIEILVHIGLDTVESKGNGFTILAKQGNIVKKNTPIVKVNYELLRKKYDMTTILVVTNSNEYKVKFKKQGEVELGNIIGKYE